ALDGSSRVLEVGVGTGRIALPLAAHAGAIYGLDLSRPMMERLRSKQQDERVFLVQGDACRLPYPAATFHATIAVHVFHLIRDWRTVVNEIARVLRPDGRLISAWGGARYGDLWREVRERVGVEHRVGIRDREELEAHLLATGWRKLGQDEYTYPQQFIPRRLITYITGRTHSWTWHATDEQIAEAAELLTGLLRERYGDLDQPVTVQSTYGAAAFAPPR
ncbi:MAG TPA: class I SAM-dependent methyltransferase, partial [Aggregatilineales bacterium]|nr:class I SAM-dependent methyltransferase [Aggregatilineales bacterium]